MRETLDIKIPLAPKNNAFLWAFGALAGIGAIAVLYIINPAGGGFFPPCVFRSITGLYCPGCGSTRAMHSLLHLDMGGALSMNPLMAVASPFMAYAMIAVGLRDAGIARLPVVRPGPVFGWTVFAVIVLYWVLRNIPVHPFSLLAP